MDSEYFDTPLLKDLSCWLERVWISDWLTPLGEQGMGIARWKEVDCGWYLETHLSLLTNKVAQEAMGTTTRWKELYLDNDQVGISAHALFR